MNNQSLGYRGETIASDYLKRKGMRIIARNVRAPRYGELDIVAIDGDTLVFVEVKTRANRRFGLPEEAVTQTKLDEIVKTAQYFVSHHPGLPALLRIDVVAIETDSLGGVVALRHIESATPFG